MLTVLYVGAAPKGTVTFEEPADDAWSLEKDADQARWFLEQPAAASSKP